MPAVVPFIPLIAAGVAGGATLGAAALSSHSNSHAADKQAQTALSAADVEAKSAADALAFAKEQEAARKAEWERTQARNYEIYLTQRKDLEPYRRLGAGAIGQMARPIPRQGSLGQMIGA